jgi:hypothetical protein
LLHDGRIEDIQRENKGLVKKKEKGVVSRVFVRLH